MAGQDNDGQQPAWTYLPKGGFSKGAKQAAWICAGLLGVLFVILFVIGAPAGTGQAVFADMLIGLIFAVAGVWVVGGMIEFSSKLYDVGVKAGGGIAILLLVTFYIRPVYGASGTVLYDVNIPLGPDSTIEQVVATFETEFHGQVGDAIQLKIAKDIRYKVLRFRPAPPRVETVMLRASGDLLRRNNPKAAILEQINAQQECLQFVREGDVFVAKLDETRLEHTTTKDGLDVFYCGTG
ncbi:hypothetical protein PGB28_10835 [Primorskyibacter aestuariivivens]|uniref:hypothetical protein n=1 Tax=Primorskyibacter aestuariivivens TaxID=1888912 RepID=UPI0022FFC56F|nr:hypothetical protein [Primorskyibacter aestuariivivens]MDA7428951.1 hypothetical protein [Primorskyibacter aestuariivivens]